MNKKESPDRMIAVIKVRGAMKADGEMKRTLELLRLYNNNYCVVLSNTPPIMGMIAKVKDYITWGEIDDETYKLMVENRGDLFKGRETDSRNKIKYSKFIVYGSKKYKPFFRLHPPRKGFERKGIKIHFKIGGALGYRGEKINELIKRMI